MIEQSTINKMKAIEYNGKKRHLQTEYDLYTKLYEEHKDTAWKDLADKTLLALLRL